MSRNKLIYALSDIAVVVASAARTCDTWAGAVEALRGKMGSGHWRSSPVVELKVSPSHEPHTTHKQLLLTDGL